MRRVLILALALALVPGLVLAACGGPRAPGAGPSTAPATSGGPDSATGTTPPAATAVTAPPPASPRPTLRLDPGVRPLSYAVELTIDPAQEEVAGTIAIELQLERATSDLWLHGKDLAIDRATITPAVTPTASASPGAAASELGATLGDDGFLHLTAARPIGPGSARLRIEYRAHAGDDEEGLFHRRDGDGSYVFTQFEPLGARRAFPCFDEPSFKVPWQLTLNVPAGDVALSNMPVERETVDGDRRTVVFARTPPMPTYLVALAVGPFELVELGTAGVNRTPVRIAVPRGRAAEAAYAKKVTGELLAALEQYLGIPFPYPKLDLVAVPGFTGAMENAGLVTYSEELILAGPGEDDRGFQQGYAALTAHELAHQWFGDLVTMSWWDDIWLNESFADFIADRVIGDWDPGAPIAMRRLRGAQRAFRSDALTSARRLRNPIAATTEIAGVFDGISYYKGNAVLAMFESWVGREAFRRALHDYLEAHAWGNARSQDFIDALAAASRPEVSAAFGTFLDQGGFPMVTVDVDCRGGAPMLVLAQERFLPIGSAGRSAQTWSIPMCVRAEGAAAEQCFLFAEPTARIELTTAACPAWIDGNPDGRGYYRTRYAGELGRALIASAATRTVSRAAALFDLGAMVEGGHASIREQLAVLPAMIADRDPDILGVGLDVAWDLERYLDDVDRPRFERWLAGRFGAPARALGWVQRPDDDAAVVRLRPRLLFVAGVVGRDRRLVAEARRRAVAYLRRPASLDPGVARIAFAAATRGGDDALARRLDGLYAKTSDQDVRGVLLAGMVVARDPAVRAKAIARLATGELTPLQIGALVYAGANDLESRAELYAFITGNLARVMAALPPMFRAGVPRMIGTFCDEAHRRDLDTIFRPALEPIPGGAKELASAIERTDLCIAQRAALTADVTAFIRSR